MYTYINISNVENVFVCNIFRKIRKNTPRKKNDIFFFYGTLLSFDASLVKT